MGSVCCVSGRDATTSEAENAEILRRSIQYSPSWGIRWDNRGCVAGDDTAVDRVRWNGRLENKSGPFFEPSPEIRILEEELDENPQSSSPLSREMECVGMQAHLSGSPEDQTKSLQIKVIAEKMPAHGGRTYSALPDIPSSSYLSPSSLPSKSHLTPSSSTPSKWSTRTPRSHLFRQGSDSVLCRRKSPSNPSASEGISSPMFSASSTESKWRSHGGSIDGLSILNFPERTTSANRQTWSLDRHSLNSHRFTMEESLSCKLDSHSSELGTCVLCSKCVNVNVLEVVAILECGHIYHATCLENLTPEISKYDPQCPVCMLGEKRSMKKMMKQLKQDERMKAKMSEKVINNMMGITPKIKAYYEPRSSLRSYLAKPFLKRHFSVNSKTPDLNSAFIQACNGYNVNT